MDLPENLTTFNDIVPMEEYVGVSDSSTSK